MIIGVLATILALGLQLIRASAVRDRGKPWALHHADSEDRAGVRRADLRSAGQVASRDDAPLDADAAVREAEQIIADP